MKHLLLLLLLATSISATVAQTPSDKLFKKYADKKGAEISVISQPPVKDTIKNTTVSSVIKTMRVSKNEDEKTISKLFKQITNDCTKLLKRKDYTMLYQEKDSDAEMKICKYMKNDTVEFFMLQMDNEELTLILTQTSGLTKEDMKNFKFKYKNQDY